MRGNIFVLAGSTPPDFPLKNYRKLCRTIKRHGCKLIIDAQGDLLLEALQCEPDFVKPNVFELAEAVGDKPSADPEVVVHSARKMLDMGRTRGVRFDEPGGRGSGVQGRAGGALRQHQPEGLR